MSSQRSSRAAIPSSLTPHPSSLNQLPHPSAHPSTLPELLFQHFDSLAETQDAVAKVRSLVLELAIRGDLAAQDISDEPALKLVERAKADLGKKREAKPGADAFNGETVPPFPLPKNWCWTCLDELGDTAPRNDLSDTVQVGFSPMRLVTIEFGEPISFERRAWNEVRKGFTHFADGDVVVAKITPCFENGKSGVIRNAPNGVGAGTTELHVFRPVPDCVLPEYALVFLKSPHFLRNGEQHMTGSAGQKRVPWDYFARTPFPLPPLPEQRRIVAKVEELLALCDALEARQTSARENRTRLVHSALDHLTAAKDEEEFRKHISFILYNSSLILEDVPSLRQAILSLAVQGRLVAQNPNDEPASILFARLRKKYRTPEISEFAEENDASRPFQLPPGWVWAHFPELGEFSRGKSKHRPRNDPILYTGGKYPLVQTGDVARANGVIRTFTGLYNETGLAQSKLWPVGTMCITIAANIADTGILGMEACFPDSVVGFVPDSELSGAQYFEFFMRTAKDRLQDFAPSTAQKNISVGILDTVLIPLPPLAEQRRIVAKVEELMRWCDQLEAHLAAASTTATHLLEATLDQILNGKRV